MAPGIAGPVRLHLNRNAEDVDSFAITPADDGGTFTADDVAKLVLLKLTIGSHSSDKYEFWLDTVANAIKLREKTVN